MPARIIPIPNFHGDALDLVLLDPANPDGPGFVHYAYTIAAADNARDRRGVPWSELRNWQDEQYQRAHAATIERLERQRGYEPGELGLASDDLANVAVDTTLRLGALELLANISSGRLAATSKDPFPHQLALQQFMRRQSLVTPRRLLIADEVGLGKTIEAGLIVRDLLLAEGSLDNFSCLYLTSGGLVQDAAEKLTEVLRGALGDRSLVQPVSSFREYGLGNINGVSVASMHAARRYVGEPMKARLPGGVSPNVLIIDECHHAACGDDLGGTRDITAATATQTFKAARQLISGSYWKGSSPPRLVILMSATPFRSHPQFLNLLRLLIHGADTPDGPIDAFAADMDTRGLLAVLRNRDVAVDVVWRRQDDAEVKSWSNRRLFPNLRIVRPHAVDPAADVRLDSPGPRFIGLLKRIVNTVQELATNHHATFGGFATAQLEKKLTSSSIAGACSLFTWCVRHSEWPTKAAFTSDGRLSTNALRAMIKKISQRLAELTRSDARFATVRFASESFDFPATRLARAEHVDLIYDFNKKIGSDDESGFILDSDEVERVCLLAEELLDFGRANVAEGTPGADEISVENAKLTWLQHMLETHPTDKFLVFTESLQTCEILNATLGRQSRQLVGSMGPAERRRAVRDLRTDQAVRILVATSAADEGFDLQVANRIVHWDLSSSPATLMQRNGRVARLGQRADVTAYYLILPGTHEERRDSRLRDRFAELGIDDEALRNKILGLLGEDEMEQLDSAIERRDDRLIGSILRAAKNDNEEMERNLQSISIRMTETAVLNREDLADRLRTWERIGLPDFEVQVSLSNVDWERPVFGEVVTVEACSSAVATVERGKSRKRVVFDPEFQVFGPDSEYELAGLRPWARRENRGRVEIRPDETVDLLGDMLCELVRLPAADFATLSSARLRVAARSFADCRWLLFCTHPVRETETEWLEPGNDRPYLTFYGFGDSDPGSPGRWASAEETHQIIKALEQEQIAGSGASLAAAELAAAELASKRLGAWVHEHIRFVRASFLTKPRLFAPIPVALVHVRDTNSIEIASPEGTP